MRYTSAMSSSDLTELKRSISLPLITFYGIGTILGAGIYVLTGKVAGVAGSYTPLAFLVASIVAAFSALSYAELSARFPKSAGEAVYVKEGLGIPQLALLVGLLIVLMGSVSTSTLLHGFVGYLQVFFPVPEAWSIVIVVVVLCAVVIWGINESVWLAAAMTVIEIFGLLLILWVSSDQLLQIPAAFDQLLLPGKDSGIWLGTLLGAFIAFYAFIGFEDIVNVAEEVKDPERNLPKAILWALVITTLLYMLVSSVSVLAMPPEQLAKSDAPMAVLYSEATGSPPVVITFISLISVINGALIQMIMASRILYGLARQGWIHHSFGRVNAKTRTPWQAILTIAGLILVFSLMLPLLSLAKITSYITLTVFAVVNLSLWRIKRTRSRSHGLQVPIWIPVAGFISCLGLLLFQVWQTLPG
jgi:amino acid transporter